jgi:predicted nucleic acid-binding protein
MNYHFKISLNTLIYSRIAVSDINKVYFIYLLKSDKLDFQQQFENAINYGTLVLHIYVRTYYIHLLLLNGDAM